MRKTLAPTPIVGAVIHIIFVRVIPPLIERNVPEAAALEKVQQFDTVRGLYDRNVVKKVL